MTCGTVQTNLLDTGVCLPAGAPVSCWQSRGLVVAAGRGLHPALVPVVSAMLRCSPG